MGLGFVFEARRVTPPPSLKPDGMGYSTPEG